MEIIYLTEQVGGKLENGGHFSKSSQLSQILEGTFFKSIQITHENKDYFLVTTSTDQLKNSIYSYTDVAKHYGTLPSIYHVTEQEFKTSLAKETLDNKLVDHTKLRHTLVEQLEIQSKNIIQSVLKSDLSYEDSIKYLSEDAREFMIVKSADNQTILDIRRKYSMFENWITNFDEYDVIVLNDFLDYVKDEYDNYPEDYIDGISVEFFAAELVELVNKEQTVLFKF